MNRVRCTQRRENEENTHPSRFIEIHTCECRVPLPHRFNSNISGSDEHECVFSSSNDEVPLSYSQVAFDSSPPPAIPTSAQQVDLKTRTLPPAPVPYWLGSPHLISWTQWMPLTPAMGEWTILERLLEAAVQQHSTMIGRWVASDCGLHSFSTWRHFNWNGGMRTTCSCNYDMCSWF